MAATLASFAAELMKTNAVIVSLQYEVAQLKDFHDAPIKQTLVSSTPPAKASVPPAASFADVVRSSVQSVLKAEEVRNNVIISGLAESENNQKDDEEVNKICDQVEINTKPIGLQRLGKKRSKVSNAQKSESSPLISFKCRPGRTNEEQKKTPKHESNGFQTQQRSKRVWSVTNPEKRGGRVLLAVDETLPSKRRGDLEPPCEVLVNSCKNNPKRFWSYFKRKPSLKSIPSAVRNDSSESDDPAVKAEMFNEYFVSVFNTTSSDLPPNIPPANVPSVPDPVFTAEGVARILTQLNANKAPNGISPVI
ncbi:hypothetical protein CAPTEDRAFT_185977 [Capitella teleta]|uniref:Uncharacterized protein n=1 Tax=Capitella teleta TaxID=283909 RepID=R7TXK6_CAPTE|nr:hypothetical protein CAPTEDRAFT_185977 [Capitella teleta]|eukprot:ELT96181.1 hypothetical protein CAPTEDRAFT_185977 [Capitella teleta]